MTDGTRAAIHSDETTLKYHLPDNCSKYSADVYTIQQTITIIKQKDGQRDHDVCNVSLSCLYMRNFAHITWTQGKIITFMWILYMRCFGELTCR